MTVRQNSLLRVPVMLITLMALSVFAQEPVERVFVVKGVIGDVMVRRNPNADRVRRERAVDSRTAPPRQSAREVGNIHWTPARINMAIREKDEIMTGVQSEVRIETPEGTTIKLGENTTVEIAALQESVRKANADGNQETVTDTRVKVREGSIIADVNKMLNGRANFRFETPTATAAIRGTVLELEVQRAEPAKAGTANQKAEPASEARTVIRAFDGVVLVAPAGTDQFVELTDGKMAEIAPKQKAVIVKDVPKTYVRMTTRLVSEPVVEEPAAKPSSKPAVDKSVPAAVKTTEPVKVTLDLKEVADTMNYYARESVTVTGAVKPVTAKVIVNGVTAKPDAEGNFKVTFAAPQDSGVYPVKIVAASGDVSETVIRTMKVAHVHTAARVLSPRDGHTVEKPVVTVNGTAMPGSRVSVQGVRLTLKRDGTFTGDVPIPDREGEHTIQVEIVGKDNNAVWIERTIIYRKKK